MSDISSGISPIGGSGVPRPQSMSLPTTQPLRDDGSIQPATTGTTSSRVTENARVSSSQSSISIANQQSQPQSPVDFGMLLLLSTLLSDDEEKNKSNPFMLLVGFALLSALQQQSQAQASGNQGAQFLQFDSQSLEISQSVSTTESASSQSATYQQASGGAAAGGEAAGGAGLGGEIDVSG